jgi:hypothetical protein
MELGPPDMQLTASFGTPPNINFCALSFPTLYDILRHITPKFFMSSAFTLFFLYLALHIAQNFSMGRARGTLGHFNF